MAKRKRKKRQKTVPLLVVLLLCGGIALLHGYGMLPELPADTILETVQEQLPQLSGEKLLETIRRLLPEEETQENQQSPQEEITLENLPAYSGDPYVELNGNQPNFTEEERTNQTPFETYSSLDLLGRCGVAYANVCQELMPTEERGSIGMVKPSGWQMAKYDCVDGKYLYNRCHLIGYQLAGENANERNLITGTRYLNVTGMLPFENQVADFVEETGYHVLYRVPPIFEGLELVARGVEMEAWSVEDGGEGVCFHVFVYNIQPGVVIDYATGESHLEEDTP